MASMIRDCPFSGETSDSDVDQDNATVEERTANNLPIKDASLKSDVSSSSSTATPGSPLLKTCAPFTAQNMRKVRWMEGIVIQKLNVSQASK